MNNNKIHILRQAKKVLGATLILAFIGEMIFFPTLPNFYGCLMAVISFAVFIYFLQEKYITYYPFAFFMYLSMFMYRFLPLIATIVEGKPITYGFERAYETFVYEIILFLISSLAFYLACRPKEIFKKNGAIQSLLNELKFFDITPSIIWGMGVTGLVIRLYNFSNGDVEYGDVSGKFLLGLDYLMYSPLILFFPSLANLKYNKNRIVWIYATLIFIINIASNSRRQIIIPIGILALLFILYLVINNLKITDFISPLKLSFLLIFTIIIIKFLSTISLAMLYTRKIRADVDKLELFQETINVVRNKELMTRLSDSKDQISNNLTKYQEGWTEEYVDNFMLARYANMRITDETLYYAEKRGYANRQMQESFFNKFTGTFPSPILNFFGIHINKEDLEYSRGDILYGSGFGNYRVTSHVGDGLATFNYWYFPFQFIVNIIIFYLLNCFVFFSNKSVKYAPFALMNVFTFLGMFRNAGGILIDLNYIIRGYIQGIITYFIIFIIIKKTLLLFNKKLIK
ncbi:hypothetical protein [Cellulophaga baltica]|uniref:hypothetical protein n=1 Tax=Cellulophaga baltica TaxID=76594 RepID=UPI002494CB7D|nr:hypothetical protein [Cellulophaga baltica]